MFERFTRAAREVVRDGARIAEQDHADRVAPEHLLLAMLGREGTAGGAILAGHAVTPAAVRDAVAAARRRGGLTEADTAALGELGIDLDAVVAAVEETHGPGALSARPRRRFGSWRTRFADESKRVLELSLTEAVDRRDRHIGDEHLLLAMLRSGGTIGDVLAGFGLSYTEVRRSLAA